MLSIFIILAIGAAGVWAVNRYYVNSIPKPILNLTKKVEEVTKNIVDVNNDGKVTKADATAVVENTKKVVKKTTKKITAKKKKQ